MSLVIIVKKAKKNINCWQTLSSCQSVVSATATAIKLSNRCYHFHFPEYVNE